MFTEIFPGIFQTEQEHPFGNHVATRAYFVVRPAGNVLFYSSSLIDACFEPIERLGGVEHQLLTHRDEASPACDRVRARFGARLVCHQAEQEAISRRCGVDETFRGEQTLAPGIEAIPTPGHTPGSTCFRLSHHGRRYLFSGDTIYLDHGTWAVLARDRDAMRGSLQVIAQLGFDALVPGLHIGPATYTDGIDARQCRERIEGCLDGL